MLPDIEQIARRRILAIVPSIPVATLIPNPRPNEFVWVRRTGGAAANRIFDRALITITSSAASTTRAKEISGLIRAGFLDSPTTIPLVRAVREITGPYLDPDPDTGGDRCTFTLELSVRAAR